MHYSLRKCSNSIIYVYILYMVYSTFIFLHEWFILGWTKFSFNAIRSLHHQFCGSSWRFILLVNCCLYNKRSLKSGNGCRRLVIMLYYFYLNNCSFVVAVVQYVKLQCIVEFIYPLINIMFNILEHCEVFACIFPGIGVNFRISIG